MNFSRGLMLVVARISPKAMLALIVVSAGATSYLYSSTIEVHNTDYKAKLDALNKAHQKEQTPILVAARDLAEGTIISSQDVELQSIDSTRFPRGAMRESGLALGMKTKYAVSTGDPVLSYSLTMERHQQGFQSKIKDGYRAVTFAVDSTTGVAGFVEPDSHVDIFTQVGAGADVRSCPILSDVQVVAAGTEYKRMPGDTEARQVNCVTVAVLPQQASKLINGMAAGKIYLTLRNNGDHTPLAVRDLSQLFPKPAIVSEQPSIPRIDFQPPPPPKLTDESQTAMNIPAPPAIHSVEMWAGSKKDETSVAP